MNKSLLSVVALTFIGCVCASSVGAQSRQDIQVCWDGKIITSYDTCAPQPPPEPPLPPSIPAPPENSTTFMCATQGEEVKAVGRIFQDRDGGDSGQVKRRQGFQAWVNSHGGSATLDHIICFNAYGWWQNWNYLTTEQIRAKMISDEHYSSVNFPATQASNQGSVAQGSSNTQGKQGGNDSWFAYRNNLNKCVHFGRDSQDFYIQNSCDASLTVTYYQKPHTTDAGWGTFDCGPGKKCLIGTAGIGPPCCLS